MHVQAILAAAVLAGFVEFACLCHEAPKLTTTDLRCKQD